MLLHVEVAYATDRNPVAKTASLSQLVSFNEWMRTQTQFPDVQPRYMSWAAQEPPAAYALFEAPNAEQMRSYLHGMPGSPAITIREVNMLSDVVPEGQAKLAKARP